MRLSRLRLYTCALTGLATLVLVAPPAAAQSRGRATPPPAAPSTGTASPAARPAPPPRINRRSPTARDERPRLMPGGRSPNLARPPNVGARPRDPVGSRRRHLPHGHSRHRVGGLIYYYWLGAFYRRGGTDYEAIHAPYGIAVDSIPAAAERLEVGGRAYFYYDGVFYRPEPDGRYSVVRAPLGAVVSHLPSDARRVTTPEGERFLARDARYVAVERDGATWYVVTGRDD